MVEPGTFILMRYVKTYNGTLKRLAGGASGRVPVLAEGCRLSHARQCLTDALHRVQTVCQCVEC